MWGREGGFCVCSNSSASGARALRAKEIVIYLLSINKIFVSNHLVTNHTSNFNQIIKSRFLSRHKKKVQKGSKIKIHFTLKGARFRKKNILVGTKFLQKREIFQKLEEKKKWNKKKSWALKMPRFLRKVSSIGGVRS
jgi:hypothetical protein